MRGRRKRRGLLYNPHKFLHRYGIDKNEDQGVDGTRVPVSLWDCLLVGLSKLPNNSTRNPLRATDTNLLPPASTEPSADDSMNHQLANIHAPADQKPKNIHVPEETSFDLNDQKKETSFDLNDQKKETSFDLSCSWYKDVPRSHRSKRRRETAETVQEMLSGELPGWSQFKPRPHSRRKQNSKVTADTSPEVIPQPSSHHRGQSRRKSGLLDSKKFTFCLEDMWKQLPEDKRNSFTYVDCLWFNLYLNTTFKAKVLNWIARMDIFSKKYVFVPIVMWGHWNLLIFCNFGESLQSRTRGPCILLLDSLQMADPKTLEPGIRKFVIDLYSIEKRPEPKNLIRKIPLLVPKVPQQRNGEDCGYFVLYYIKLFLGSAPVNFSISEGYPYFMKLNWFTPKQLECFRQEVHSIEDCSDDEYAIEDESDDEFSIEELVDECYTEDDADVYVVGITGP